MAKYPDTLCIRLQVDPVAQVKSIRLHKISVAVIRIQLIRLQKTCGLIWIQLIQLQKNMWFDSVAVDPVQGCNIRRRLEILSSLAGFEIGSTSYLPLTYLLHNLNK